MNANKRMKYASTPTYGMQKRGFSKRAASAQPSPLPDFTQAPSMPEGGIPFMPSSLAPIMPTAFVQSAVAAQAPFMPQGTQVGNPFPGINLSPQPKMGTGFFQPQPIPQAASISQPVGSMPLGNAPFAVPPQNGFAPRQQGFVPAALAVQNGALPGSFQQPATDSALRPPFTPAPTFGGQAYPNQPNPAFFPQTGTAAPQTQAAFMPQNGAAPSSQPFANPAMAQNAMQPAMPSPQQGMYSGHPNMTKASNESGQRDPLWMGILFGLLPALFIPCLFVPASLDFIRYGFIILCVFSLGVMWYKQMFTSNTRATISIIYAALCIVAISFLLNGNADVKETNGNQLGGSLSVQTTPPPEDYFAAGATENAPTEAPTEAPSTISAAEERLTTFMNLWAFNREPSEMVSLVQPSWASAKDNPTAELFKLLTNRTPENYVIEEVGGTDADTSRNITMSAYINKNNGKESTRYRFTVVMVKEGGEWYIDPNTLASTDVITGDSASAEATATESISSTLEPRMTETPVPDLNVLLYYNPDGGKSYHADENCSRVDSKYLPLQGSFPYSDFTSFLSQRNLQPCLECRAPTKAADADS